jgi:flavin reductase (DIM6/NTAB) family NADH-FMN oxidoreductase RutF
VATAGIPVGPFPSDTDPDAYDRLRRRVLWMLPSGLYLLGSRAGDRRNLMTLNWATQLSFDPKLVGVSVEAGALTHRLVDEGGVFALSLLAREDRAVVRKFVKPAQEGAGGNELNGSPGVGPRCGVAGLRGQAAGGLWRPHPVHR